MARLKRRRKALKRKNPMVNFHNIKVRKGKTKRPTKSQISRYRVQSWRGGHGIRVLYGIRKKAGPRGGKSIIMSLRFPIKNFTLQEAKKYAKEHKFKIVEAEAARAKKKKIAKKKKTKKKTKKKASRKSRRCKKCKKAMRINKLGRPRLRHKRCAA